MLADFLVNACSILLISLLIAHLANSPEPSKDLGGFLFGGNSKLLAVSSNIGTLLSVTILFNLYFNGLFGFGLLVVVAMSAGIVVGYCLLEYLLKRICFFAPGPALRRTTLLSLVPGGENVRALRFIFYVQYFIAITSEFGVIVSILRALLPESAFGVDVAMVLLSVMCATYTSVGGYAGILRTDLFQLLVFATATTFLFVTNLPGAFDLFIDEFTFANVRTDTPIPIVTFFLFTVVGMGAFPDMWVRNLSSMTAGGRFSFVHLRWSIVGLLLLLVPISFAALLVFRAGQSLDARFLVPRVHAHYAELTASAGEIMAGFSGWCVVATLICAFITTTDTWLIGILQHVGVGKRRASGAQTAAIVYGTSIAAMVLARVLCDTPHGLYILGLLIFPFLWFNTIFLVAGAFPRLRTLRSVPLLLSSIAIGLGVAVFQIQSNLGVLEKKPHLPVLVSGACVYSVFVLSSLAQMLFRRRQAQ